MNSRRLFLSNGIKSLSLASALSLNQKICSTAEINTTSHDCQADAVVCGGGLGGIAATLALLDMGLSVILVEETSWLGGQLTSQGVPPDENQWIESFGCTAQYAELRRRIRNAVKANPDIHPSVLNSDLLNPGNGSVSRLCVEPRISAKVIHQWVLSQPNLRVFFNHSPIAADTQNHKIRSISIANTLLPPGQNSHRTLSAPWFIDATELGDLLPLSQTSWTTGNEGKAITHELHAPEKADPQNQQAFTLCFALTYNPDHPYSGPKPPNYDFWKNYSPNLTPPWPGKLFDLTYSHPRSLQPRLLGFNPQEPNQFKGVINLWTYRRIVDKSLFVHPPYPGDVSLVNWPQNDYLLGNLINVSSEEKALHLKKAKEMNLCFIHWLQTEAPRPHGGQGYPGLHLCPGAMGTPDGMAMAPYIRESRRIQALETISEADCGVEQRQLEHPKNSAAHYRSKFHTNSVGIGHYPIDLHPTTSGDNYIDFPTFPFQIPLGALIPQNTRNLIAANKNIGTTHLTNGCYRLHPIEWNIGESAGRLIGFCQLNNTTPHLVHHSETLTRELQNMLTKNGIPTQWPDEVFL
jgi:hypothetical protein